MCRSRGGEKSRILNVWKEGYDRKLSPNLYKVGMCQLKNVFGWK